MNILVLFSGGLDSTALLYEALATVKQYEVDMKEPGKVKAISFNYGQRHKKELACATDNARSLGVEHVIVQLDNLKAILNRGVLTAGGDVPEGHYAEESMKQTVVPNRNMIMLSIAAGHAMANGFSHVWFAAHAGDHAIYPDCRLEFVNALSAALAQADWTPVTLRAPFIAKTKAEIVARGVELDVPFNNTWSCYKGGAKHCGKCGTCVERREAFQLAGVRDPTLYE